MKEYKYKGVVLIKQPATSVCKGCYFFKHKTADCTSIKKIVCGGLTNPVIFIKKPKP